jgi:hypothetical protein
MQGELVMQITFTTESFFADKGGNGISIAVYQKKNNKEAENNPFISFFCR